MVIQVCSGEACFRSKTRTPPQWTHCGPERAFSHAIFGSVGGLHESHACLQRHLHKVFSLSTYLRVPMRKENHRLRQMIEGENTTSPSPGSEASSYDSRPGKG